MEYLLHFLQVSGTLNSCRSRGEYLERFIFYVITPSGTVLLLQYLACLLCWGALPLGIKFATQNYIRLGFFAKTKHTSSSRNVWRKFYPLMFKIQVFALRSHAKRLLLTDPKAPSLFFDEIFIPPNRHLEISLAFWPRPNLHNVSLSQQLARRRSQGLPWIRRSTRARTPIRNCQRRRTP